MTSISPSSTDSSLLRRVQSEDAVAWSQFVDLYGPLIYFWAKRVGLDSHDAADILQDTLGATARSICDFRQQKSHGSLRGWLWTITRNKLNDHFRRLSAARAVGGSDMARAILQLPEQLPDDEQDNSAQQQMWTLLQRAVAQVQAEFEARTWQAFWRVVVDHCTTADVAAELGLSANSVRQAKSRVLRRLREQLIDWPE